MIRFEHISKKFGGQVIVDDVSGTLEKSKTNLIIGASGAGKTVLVKCIVGLIAPTTGRIYYDDHLFYPNPNYRAIRAIRLDIGMLFQAVALFDSKSVEENVRFPLDLLTRMTTQEKRRRVDVCLDRVGLPGINKKMPSELSGGMKKRVGIARAIINRPKYLFCDEPNSGLDPQTAIRIDRLISDITAEYHMTTVVITHDMNSVFEIGDRVLFVYQGKEAWHGDKHTILKTQVPALRSFMMSNKLIRNMLEGEDAQATTSNTTAA